MFNLNKEYLKPEIIKDINKKILDDTKLLKEDETKILNKIKYLLNKNKEKKNFLKDVEKLIKEKQKLTDSYDLTSNDLTDDDIKHIKLSFHYIVICSNILSYEGYSDEQLFKLHSDGYIQTII
jgi:site-specific DNA-adenine methylase